MFVNCTHFGYLVTLLIDPASTTVKYLSNPLALSDDK